MGQKGNLAAGFEFAAVRCAAGVVWFKRDVVEDDSSDRQAVAVRSGGDQRLQGLVDHAQAIRRHDHQRETKLDGQVGYVVFV